MAYSLIKISMGIWEVHCWGILAGLKGDWKWKVSILMCFLDVVM